MENTYFLSKVFKKFSFIFPQFFLIIDGVCSVPKSITYNFSSFEIN